MEEPSVKNKTNNSCSGTSACHTALGIQGSQLSFLGERWPIHDIIRNLKMLVQAIHRDARDSLFDKSKQLGCGLQFTNGCRVSVGACLKAAGLTLGLVWVTNQRKKLWLNDKRCSQQTEQEPVDECTGCSTKEKKLFGTVLATVYVALPYSWYQSKYVQ